MQEESVFKRKEICQHLSDSHYFTHYVQCLVLREDMPPLIDVPQLTHEEETNLPTEIDKLDKSCRKRHQIFK